MPIFSHSGLSTVALDFTVGANAKRERRVGVASAPHFSSTPSKHSCGERLIELADVVVDSGVPKGDFSVEIEGLKRRVGPTPVSIAIGVGRDIDAVSDEITAANGQEPYAAVCPNMAEHGEPACISDRNHAGSWRPRKDR